jgi:anti-anti-sigma factor
MSACGMNSDGPAPVPRSEAHREGCEGPPVLDQPFDQDSLSMLRAAAEAYASQAGLAAGRCVDLVIAVHELAANAVRHGGGAGRLRIWKVSRVLHCQVSDDGPLHQHGNAEQEAGVAKTAAQNVAAGWPYGQGHGLWMVRQVADELSLRSGPGGTIATVTFGLPAPGSAQPLRLTEHTRDGRTVLAVAGDLDQRTAPDLSATVDTLVMASPALHLVLDLTALTSLDAAGVAALIKLQQHVNGWPTASMTLTGAPSQFKQRLQASGLTS